MACGMSLSKNLWDLNGITGVQIKYCDVLDPSNTETFETEGFSSGSAEELECDPGYYIDGISAKFQEQPQGSMESTEPGTVPLDILAMAELYASYDSNDWYSADWKDPRLDGYRGFHNGLATFVQDSEFWVSVAFPTDETLLVKKMDFQKRGDGNGPTRIIPNIKIKYLCEYDQWVDYMDGAEIPTGQLSSDSINLKREIWFTTPLMAKQVKIYFLCDGSQCERGGRFDLTVEKTSFALLNHGASHSQESSSDASWEDPKLFSDRGYHQLLSQNGVIPMWVQIDFPSSEAFLVKNLALQKRGDYTGQYHYSVTIDYLNELDQWVSYQEGATIQTGQLGSDSSDVIRYVDFSGDPFIAKKVKITMQSVSYSSGRLDLTIKKLKILEYENSISQVQLRCSKIYDQSDSEQLTSTDDSSNPSFWTNSFYSDSRFICGFEFKTFECNFNKGIYGFSTKFCTTPCDPDLGAQFTNTLLDPGSTLTTQQEYVAGTNCYFRLYRSDLVQNPDCPLELQVFVSQTDTATQVSQFVGTGLATASNGFHDFDNYNFWYWDGISQASEYQQRDEAYYQFYIRITQYGGYTEWIGQELSLFCDPCIDDALGAWEQNQNDGKTFVYDLNSGNTDVNTITLSDLVEKYYFASENTESSNGCKALYYQGFVDSDLTIQWSDPAIVISPADTIKPETFAGTLTTQTVALQTHVGFKKSLYIQGKNTGKQANYIRTNFVVCGQETVINNQPEDYVNINLQKFYTGGQVQSQTFVIDQATYETWFTTTEGSDSDKDCLKNPTYSLCQDQNCLSAYTDTQKLEIIDSDDFQVTLNPFDQVDIFLRIYFSQGKISATRKMSLAVCGLETISMTNTSLEFTREYELGSSVEGTNTSWIIYSSEFESNFISSNPDNCPIYLFDIQGVVTFDNSEMAESIEPNTNLQLSVEAWDTNSNFNILIETTGSFNWTTYYLRASTQSTFDTPANNAFIPLHLQVINCAEQNITIVGQPLVQDLVQFSTTMTKPLVTSVVELFNSSHPLFCPITSYRVQKVENSLGKDVTEDVSSWIYFGTNQKDTDQYYWGNLVVSQSLTLESYEIFIEASTGNVTSSIEDPIAFLFISEEPNRPPMFFGELEEEIIIDLNKKNSYEYLLPETVDINKGQTVSLSVEFEAEFITYDEELKTLFFDGISESDIGEYIIKLTLQDNKMGIEEYEIEVIVKKPAVFVGVIIPIEEEIIEIVEEEIVIEESNPEFPIVKAKVTEVSNFGDVTVEFSEDMEFVDFNKIDSKVLNIELIPFMVPDGYNMSNLAFTWKAISYSGNKLQLKISFNNPIHISLNLQQDDLIIRFLNGAKMFASKETGQILDSKFQKITESVKKQMPDNDATKNFESASEMADKVLKYAFWTTLGLNILMTGSESMDYFIAMINSLQMIIHLPMLWVVIPGNVALFFKLILPIVMFDVLDSLDDTKYDPNNYIPYDEDLNQLDKNKFIIQMKDLGYKTHNSILNLGSLFILLVIYFIRMAMLVPLYLAQLISGKWKSSFKRQKRKVFFYDLLLILVEGYMEFFISGYLNFQKPLFQSEMLGEKISVIISWFSMAACLLIVPAGLCYVIDQDKHTLENNEFEQAFGSVYEGINTNTGYTRSYFLFFILRRLLFCCISFFLTWSATIQIQCVLLLNILYILYIGSFKPKQRPIFNLLEIISELMIQLSTIHLMMFTDFLSDPDIQYKAGYFMIGVIVILMCTHLAFVIRYGVKSLILITLKYFRLLKWKIFGKEPQPDVINPEEKVIVPKKVRPKLPVLEKYSKMQDKQSLSKVVEEFDEIPDTPKFVPTIDAPQTQPFFEKLSKQNASKEIKKIVQEPIVAKTKKKASFGLPSVRSEPKPPPKPKPKKTKKKKIQKKEPEIVLKEELASLVNKQLLEQELNDLLEGLDEEKIQKKAQAEIEAALDEDIQEWLEGDPPIMDEIE